MFEEQLTSADVAARKGSRTFLLDTRAVWRVRSGRVDVFLVALDDEQRAGPRRHLFRVEEGEALFGFGSHATRDGWGLLAVGTAETELETCRDLPETGAPHPARAGRAAPLVDAWVYQLSRVMATGAQRDAPGEFAELEVGEAVLLPPETDARPKHAVAWIRHVEGRSLFMGSKRIGALEGAGPFPLSDVTWLRTQEVSRIVPVETALLVDEGAVWDGLHHFHAAFVAWSIQANVEAMREERARLRDRATHHRSMLSQAFAQLASVFDFRRAHADGIESNEPFLAAGRAVAERLGIDIKAPPEREEEVYRRDPVGSIARASRLRTRTVALRGDWWTQDNGPLLGRIKEDGRPVALLPASAGRYEAYDPSRGEVRPVDEDVAESLHPFASSFYRPFPREALSIWGLLKFGLAPCRKDLLVILLMGAGGGILSMAIPVVTGLIFDDVIPSADRGQLFQLTLALLVAASVAALFRITQSLALLRVQGKLIVSTQSATWDRLLSLPLSFFRAYSAGDLAKRAMSLSQIQQLLSGPTIMALLGGVFAVFNYGLLFYFSVELALWASLLVGVALCVTLLGGWFHLRYGRQIARVGNRISSLVLQFLTGVSKLRVAGSEAKAFSLWAEHFSEKRRLQYRRGRIDHALKIFNRVFPLLTTLVVFALAVPVLAQEGGLSTGGLLAFLAALTAFLSAIIATSSAVTQAFGVIPLYENAQPILKSLPEVDETKADPGRLAGAIEMQHVMFRYHREGRLILNDLSIEIEPGEFVALVGPSGSGKSTILRLLLGFERPEAGSIYFDEHDLSGLDLQAVRRQIGVVLQDGKLMPGDLFTNITGSSIATMDDAWQAAARAGLKQDIDQMPMGMHTVVSEGGSTLSGGQVQRLMIARAIVNSPRILFFDEATSALDNRTQAIISESLEALEATRVVVAHRLSTIRNADRIFVVKAGRIVEKGSYDALMRCDGVFAELARRQLA